MALDLQHLAEMSNAELETLFRETRAGEWQPGLYRGHYLRPIGSFTERPMAMRLATEAGFHLTPFWIDHERDCWAFLNPALRAGRFSVSRGPSRWRKTDCLRLDYSRSRLPGMVRSRLYDEIKPLGPDLCLGIGGLNAWKEEGEYFFFALSRC